MSESGVRADPPGNAILQTALQGRLLTWALCRLGRHDLEERFYRMPTNDIRHRALADDMRDVLNYAMARDVPVSSLLADKAGRGADLLGGAETTGDKQ